MEKVSRLFKTHYSVKIFLLCAFRITRIDGQDITPTVAKARCIIAILAFSENGEITREKLTRLLWSRHAPEQARTSLRQCLSQLRRTFHFSGEELFSADRYKVYLKKDSVWADIDTVLNHPVESDTRFLSGLSTDSILENLNINDPAFQAWLCIKKQAMQEAIKNILQNPQEEITQNEHKNSVTSTHYEKSSLSRNFSLYRSSLLKKVESFWVDSVLKQSLFKKITIELQLRESSEQMLQAWQGVVQYSINEDASTERCVNNTVTPSISPAGSATLRNNTEIGEIFTEFSESMLILGAPGSGKTTLLLHLTQQLLERANKNSDYPVPVVFHLSTWARQRTSIATWLEDELENRYQMPGRLSATLIQKQDILPLLDGLDEVDSHYRKDCVREINLYRQQNNWLSIAVCSRQKDYRQLSIPLMTTGTVYIQDITEQQCNAYLEAIKEPYGGLNSALEKNTQLRNLLTTPLMLNIASIAYRDYTPDTLPHESSQTDPEDHLFSTYTQAMLSRKPSPSSDTHYSKDDTCHWLSWLACTLDEEKQSVFYLDSIQPCRASRHHHYWIITRGSVIICGLLTGLMLGLLGSFVTDLKYSLGISLFLGITGGYTAGLLGYGDQIRPLVHVKLSWKTLRSVSILKHIGNLALASSFALGVILIYGPSLGIPLGILLFSLNLVLNALDFEPPCKQQSKRTTPNEGIHRSLRHVGSASIIGGAAGLAIGFFAGGVQGAMAAGALTALLSALFFGGHTCIQHYLLRFFLWRCKNMPLNYIPFLEFAVERIFLYRVGGGYIFIHRSLAEYFARKSTRTIKKTHE